VDMCSAMQPWLIISQGIGNGKQTTTPPTTRT